MGDGVSAAPRRSVRARVTGHVQGVGFRWFVMRRAQALGVAGWVRNADDGAVEVAVQGPPDRVEQLLAALRTGPPHAAVQSVDVDERADDASAENAEFEILP